MKTKWHKTAKAAWEEFKRLHKRCDCRGNAGAVLDTTVVWSSKHGHRVVWDDIWAPVDVA